MIFFLDFLQKHYIFTYMLFFFKDVSLDLKRLKNCLKTLMIRNGTLCTAPKKWIIISEVVVPRAFRSTNNPQAFQIFDHQDAWKERILINLSFVYKKSITKLILDDQKKKQIVIHLLSTKMWSATLCEPSFIIMIRFFKCFFGQDIFIFEFRIK